MNNPDVIEQPKTPTPVACSAWLGVYFDANGVAQVVWPRKTRMYLRWRFAEWQLLPRLVITRYLQEQSRTNAKMMSRLSIVALWLFIVFEMERDA